MSQLGKRRGIATNKRAYPHLAFQMSRSKEAIFYRFKGRNVRIWSDPETQPEQFKADYDRAVVGEDVPRPAFGKIRLTAKAGTWSAALDDWIDAEYRPLAPATKRSYDPFVALLRDVLGDRMIRDTDPWALFRIHKDFVQKGQLSYANTLLSVLKGVVKIATIHRWNRDPNILLGIEHQEIESTHYRPWRQDEVDSWREAYTIQRDLMARAVFELSYHFGLASVDLTRFAPCHIDENGDINIQRQKTGGLQTGNINSDPTLRAIVDALIALPRSGDDVVDMQGRSTAPLLRNQYGKPLQASALRKQWARWREAIGLADDFNIHSARATLVTDMVENGVLHTDGMGKTGHADMRTYLGVYGHAANKTPGAIRAEKVLGEVRAKRAGGRLRSVA